MSYTKRDYGSHFATLRHVGRLYRYSDVMAKHFQTAIRDAIRDGLTITSCAFSADVTPETIRKYRDLPA